MATVASIERCRSKETAEKDPPCHDQKSDGRHRVTRFQHRDITDDDFRERVYPATRDRRHPGVGDANVSGLAQSIRARSELRVVGKVEVARRYYRTTLAVLRRKIPGRR